METKVFKNYSEFLSREDKKINGVSAEFASDNPGYAAMNSTNKACWNCRSCSYCSYCSSCWYCSDCSYCSSCSDCSYCSSCWYCSYCSSCWYCSDCSSCSYCSDCSYCSSCWYCSDCSSCSYCSYCSSCSSCSSCSDCSYCKNCKGIKREEKVTGNEPSMVIPVVENIHTKVYEAITEKPESFDMGSWHNSCGTTHCRAGWVVHIAGEAGYALEKMTNTAFAAMQIYKASSPIRVSPYRFYETNELALNNIKELAEQESSQKD